MKSISVVYRGRKILVKEDIKHPLKYVTIEINSKHLLDLLGAIDTNNRMHLKQIVWCGGVVVTRFVKGKVKIVDVINYDKYINSLFERGAKTIQVGSGYYLPTTEKIYIYPESFLPDIMNDDGKIVSSKIQKYVNNTIIEELAHACQPARKSMEHYVEMVEDKYKPHLIQLGIFYTGVLLFIGQFVANQMNYKPIVPVWILGFICWILVIYDIVKSEKKRMNPRLYSTDDYRNDYFEISAKKRTRDGSLLKLAELAFKIG